MNINLPDQQRRKLLTSSLAAGSLVGIGIGQAYAAGSADEAAKLKTTLTPMGAERAGNADGTIPAWNGGYTQIPAGFKPGGVRPDPFSNEKPRFTITSGTASNYSRALSPGVMAMFKRYNDYRIEVYPSRRTAAAPQWIYDNTFANATRAQSLNDGLVIKGAYGGVPFPIPKSGREAMWNHLLNWQGESIEVRAKSIVNTANGGRITGAGLEASIEYPYFYKDGSAEKFNGTSRMGVTVVTEPALRSGEALLNLSPVDTLNDSNQVWQYSPGQRRVRKAPNLSYDAPNFVSSGINNFDELFLFAGALDRYDWKIIGKQEMIIPYNCNGAMEGKLDDLCSRSFLNPDKVRWELHRVWVIEATLAEGKRNVVSKRRYYLDEDCWHAVLGEGYDAKGDLWKLYQGLPLLMYDLPAVSVLPYAVTNLQTGAWMLDSAFNEQPYHWRVAARKPAKHFTPENLATLGVR
jgi:Protein of unknown function (DUF1329)